MGENPSEFQGEKAGSADARRLPVENLDWHQAGAFCERLNQRVGVHEGEWVFRLPTEAEWEYACRAGTESAFNDDSPNTNPDGTDPALEKLGWHGEGSDGKTHPVGLKKSNNWGLYDMHGNVWEWCVDSAEWKARVVTDTYTEGIEDPVCRVGAGRVVRGGCFWHFAGYCRSATRDAYELGYRRRLLGFRLAAGPVAEPAQDGSGASGVRSRGAVAPGR